MRKGSKHTPEAKEKVRQTLLRKGIKPPYRKGFRLSEDTKRKISLAGTGRKMPPRTESWKRKKSESQKSKGVVPPSRKGIKWKPEWIAKREATKDKVGRHYSIEARKKIGDGHRGEKHWNWKGGRVSETLKIRASLEYKLWREAVFKRDDFTCIWCGQRGGRLNADHIKGFADFPELRFSIDNGRTLCVPCHTKTDNYGWKYQWGKRQK